MNNRTRLPLPEPVQVGVWARGISLGSIATHTPQQMFDYSDAECAPLMAEIEALRQDGSKLTAENAALLVEVSGFRSARIAYASEFPLNADGEPDIGNIHANIRAVKARVKVLEYALRRIAYYRTPGRTSKLVEVLESMAIAALEAK